MAEIIYPIFILTVLTVLAPILGVWIYKFTNPDSKLPTILIRVENLWKKITGTNSWNAQTPLEYFSTFFQFHMAGLAILWCILFFQNYFTLNPAKISGMSWDLALNTAISFVTNTNWQAYSGEAQVSYFGQSMGLALQNFLSASAGICVLLVISRAFGNAKETIGNFWQDLYRLNFYIFLPLSVFLALLLISEGVPQNYDAPVFASLVEGGSQSIPGGPAASQIAIKQLGTNGGGFFGVNSAHPLENPTPFSNFLQTFAILLIPTGCVFLYGKIVGSLKHAWVVFGVMLFLLVIGYSVAYYSELQSITSWEGKESRFHLAESTFWMSATTAASNGSVNSMHDSYSPIGGMMGMLQIMMGEVIFGGVGAGMYGMVLFVLATVFLSGLMIGRTPEIFGKKIQKDVIKWTFIGLLIPNICILVFSSIAVSTDWGLEALTNRGPHGLSEILYAYASASGNNGSAFAGLEADSIPYNLTLGFCMFLGRFGVIYSIFRIADLWLKAKKSENPEGSFRVDSFLFGSLLFFVLLILAGLSFFPVLSLGPILESFLVGKEIYF